MRLFVVTYSQTSCKRLPEKLSLDFHILESLHIVTGPFHQRSADGRLREVVAKGGSTVFFFLLSQV